MMPTFGGADDAINLTDDEATAVAKHVVANRLRDDPEWPDWADLPYLGEHAFERLVRAVDAEVGRLGEAARAHDGSTGIDSADILSRARG